ncbi:MAG: PilT/PilU family type 4a pilus ATPase [Nitrospirae bacterium]|nr:PilT/PilU family type 4a pilus ATPase [Nitrospirota bacterium]
METDARKGRRQRLGEMMVQQGVITINQLKDALKVLAQSGGRLGSLLVELGYTDIDTLLRLLGAQLDVPTVDLYQITIEPSVLALLPFGKMKKYEVLPLTAGEKNVTVAMVNPGNLAAISDLEFILGRPVHTLLAPSLQIAAAIKTIEDRGCRLDEPVVGKALQSIRKRAAVEADMPDIRQLFKRLVDENASDLLLAAGVPPSLKKDNEVRRLTTSLMTPQQIKACAWELMSAQQREEFERNREIDFAYTLPDVGRFRLNIYKQRNSISLAARHIIEIIPTMGELGLPAWIADVALKTQGLILVTGPVGHGKTTTLAALVDIVNTRRKCNIITIEDPVEYLHKHKSSNVNQREVGIDTDSFHEGLRHIFRQAPDVIVIGEMRDPESFAIALQAADTGHLVMSTLHSNSATSAVERIIDIFPAHQQQQLRVQFAENFLLIFNQRLVPMKEGEGRILAYEKLANTYRVRSLIREGKSHQIRSLFQQSTEDFSSIELSLARLCIEGQITPEAGVRFCENPAYFNDLVERGLSR